MESPEAVSIARQQIDTEKTIKNRCSIFAMWFF
jgi:hypothetical protein